MNTGSAFPTESELWDAAAAAVGLEVPEPWRRYCELRGWVRIVLHSPEPDSRRDAFEYIVEDLRLMAQAGVDETGRARVGATPQRDGRWPLIAELIEASQQAAGTTPSHRPWEPISIERRTALELRTGAAGAPLSGRVGISFDDRLSLRALVDELRRLWPELRREGYVRRTRPLGERTLALLRFVCMASEPDTPWRERWEAWNRSRREPWRFKDARAFTTTFHRAERQLTGEAHGLAPFYDRAALLHETDRDAFRRLLEASNLAARKVDRRFRDRARDVVSSFRRQLGDPAQIVAAFLERLERASDKNVAGID